MALDEETPFINERNDSLRSEHLAKLAKKFGSSNTLLIALKVLIGLLILVVPAEVTELMSISNYDPLVRSCSNTTMDSFSLCMTPQVTNCVRFQIPYGPLKVAASNSAKEQALLMGAFALLGSALVVLAVGIILQRGYQDAAYGLFAWKIYLVANKRHVGVFMVLGIVFSLAYAYVKMLYISSLGSPQTYKCTFGEITVTFDSSVHSSWLGAAQTALTVAVSFQALFYTLYKGRDYFGGVSLSDIVDVLSPEVGTALLDMRKLTAADLDTIIRHHYKGCERFRLDPRKDKVLEQLVPKIHKNHPFKLKPLHQPKGTLATTNPFDQ